MKNKALEHFHWLPLIFYGGFMLIVSIIYSIKWDLTIMIGVWLIALFVLIPFLLFSILNTAIKHYKGSNKQNRFLTIFVSINIVSGALLIAGLSFQIYSFFSWSDWWVYSISLIGGIILYTLSLIFLVQKKRR